MTFGKKSMNLDGTDYALKHKTLKDLVLEGKAAGLTVEQMAFVVYTNIVASSPSIMNLQNYIDIVRDFYNEKG